MKRIKGVKKILIILAVLFIVYLVAKQCWLSYYESHKDEFAKWPGRDDIVLFGDGTYKIWEVTSYEGKELYPLYKVVSGGGCYLSVEEYIVINHIAYIKGVDRQDNSIKLFAVLDYNNDKIKVENSIDKFSDEEINIFQNEEFINFYNTPPNIVREYD